MTNEVILHFYHEGNFTKISKTTLESAIHFFENYDWDLQLKRKKELKLEHSPRIILENEQYSLVIKIEITHIKVLWGGRWNVGFIKDNKMRLINEGGNLLTKNQIKEIITLFFEMKYDFLTDTNIYSNFDEGSDISGTLATFFTKNNPVKRKKINFIISIILVFLSLIVLIVLIV